ncbi:MAG: hypothetical protein HY934_04420 [Candidatus Firestonebacteria bacterium]|nr:hypothetical protein [Candidatus Firestonebacteria bacterium]
MYTNTKMCLLVLFIMLGVANITLAASSVTQSVNFQVSAVNEITVAGAPSLTINTGTAGSDLSDVTAAATYSITTNGSGKKITGQITTGGDMPSGTALKINLTAPTGGTSALTQTLISTGSVDLVTGVTKTLGSGLGITYTFSASVAAGEVSGSRTVTLTITN